MSGPSRQGTLFTHSDTQYTLSDKPELVTSARSTRLHCIEVVAIRLSEHKQFVCDLQGRAVLASAAVAHGGN